jgi:hypothetical protein
MENKKNIAVESLFFFERRLVFAQRQDLTSNAKTAPSFYEKTTIFKIQFAILRSSRCNFKGLTACTQHTRAHVITFLYFHLFWKYGNGRI